MNKIKNTKSGAVMVEASIYFPLVICTVMTMIYLALFQMQESALGYVAERIAIEVAREEAYPGYAKFNMNDGRAVDFSWSGTMPSENEVEDYYTAHHENLGALYRECGDIANLISSKFGGSGGDVSDYETKYANTADTYRIFAAGAIGEPEINIDRGFFSSTVTVSIKHTFPVPRVIQYLGISDEQYIMQTTATKHIINSGEFVRNVDLAVDLTDYLLQKLGLDQNVNAFIDKAKAVIEKL